MTSKLLFQQWLVALVLYAGMVNCRAESALPTGVAAHCGLPAGVFAFPHCSNDIQLLLCTNATPPSAAWFNTFSIRVGGETLLPFPVCDGIKEGRSGLITSASGNFLVNGAGPKFADPVGATVVEHAAGPDWQYAAFDFAPAYRDRLTVYRRAILFVAPDLFVIYDHAVARTPARFQMVLHPPSGIVVDPIWGDLRLELPRTGMLVHAPAPKNQTRRWELAEASTALSGTVTVQLGPTNQLPQFDLLTVFAVHRYGEKRDYAFRLLESTSAIGTRIHRQGLPTLIAFRTDAAAAKSSLTGFEFSGPVGVDVFQPKRRL